MKVVVAIDDSPYSKTVVDAVCTRRWPVDTQFRIVTVMEPITVGCERESESFNLVVDLKKKRQHHLDALCSEARHRIEKAVPSSIVHYEVAEGDPKQSIVDAAVEWEADRILLGARGRSVCPHFSLGSVSRTVASQALCTVEVIREPVHSRHAQPA